jgi:predicted Zn finger-like uncharacterized protein
MTLPCPHCKNSFNLDPELLARGSIKLRCPSCNGLFVVKAPQPREPDPAETQLSNGSPQGPEADSAPKQDSLPGEREEPPVSPATDSEGDPFREDWAQLFGEDSITSEGEPIPEDRPDPSGKTRQRFTACRPALFSLFFILAACAGLFFAVFWKGDGTVNTDAKAPGTAGEFVQAVPEENGSRGGFGIRVADLDDQGAGSFFRAIRPFSSADTDATCRALLDLQERVLKGDHPDPCVLYPPWIAYLAMENSPESSPACKWEAPYRLAIGGIRKGTLCARGNAFLAAYYAHKKIPDRALSFLREAQAMAPLDPWVRIAEVLYQQRILRDREKAEEILHEIVDDPPVSVLSWYLLSCIYISKGEYDTAGDFFDPLVRAYPEQVQFQRIREALSSTQEAAYFSPERARGILDLGVSFAAMRDYVMAEELCQEVLREMPDRLSVDEKKIAYLELGRIHEIRGDKVKASVSYRSALRLDPQFSEAKLRIRTLFPNRAEYF